MRWKKQNGPRVLETSLKNKKDGGRVAEDLFWLSFQDVFWKFLSRYLPLTGSGQIQMKTNTHKKLLFGFNLSVNVYASENPYKNGGFLFGF